MKLSLSFPVRFLLVGGQTFAPEGRNANQHDAYSVAAWMRRADVDGSLAKFLQPSLTPAERAAAQIEGWILGVE